MKGRAPPTDLLVCFPSRAHLSLTHKPISSPSRPKPAPFRPNTQMGPDVGSEPTSPKVTCAGQIKVRHKARAPKISWIESLGLKKDVAGLLAALRGGLRFRLNMPCLGSFHGPVESCSDEEDDGGGAHERSVLTEWFMVLDEELRREEAAAEEAEPPPRDALLLMRCRSAPAARKEREEGDERREKEGEEERMMLMSYAPDFFKLSTEIAKETWVVGNGDPSLGRSRSCKR